MTKVKIIGAGLAGCEAAYQLAKLGVAVQLWEQKPLVKSEAHILDGFAELVCSNSLKSVGLGTASGLLKAELGVLDCLLLKLAEQASVPAGSALTVDRVLYSQIVTQEIKKIPNITINYGTVDSIDPNVPTIIATGPLTKAKLADCISQLCGGFLDFFDAVSPIVDADSIDMSCAFVQDRYNKTIKDSGNNSGVGDYINCPLTLQEYQEFCNALVLADRVRQKDWENVPYFDSCMPIEVIADRGFDTMRFGPMRPVGFVDPNTGRRPYAVLQLRKENTQGNAYNLVGFQTSLKFGEQKKVFGMIPALKNAKYHRYGTMHRNSFVNAPVVLDANFAIKNHPNTYIAGQLSGVEGYVESIMSGLIVGLQLAHRILGLPKFDLPSTTICGALMSYLTTDNKYFSPMNANFGLLPTIDIRDKTQRKQAYADRAIDDLKKLAVKLDKC